MFLRDLLILAAAFSPFVLLVVGIVIVDGSRLPTGRKRLLCGAMVFGFVAWIGCVTLVPVFRMSREGYCRAESFHHLKHLAQALDRYQQEQGTFPLPGVYDQEGRALLSWRVLILPHLGHADLYRQFKLDAPWDSPENAPLLDRMPEVFSHPRQASSSATHYQVFVGPGTVFEGHHGIRKQDVPHSGVDTLLLVEAAEAVPWTKPADLVYSEDQPVPRLGGLARDVFLVALVDGSVRTVNEGTGDEILRMLIKRNAEKRLGRDW